jgi:hypothetical protein
MTTSTANPAGVELGGETVTIERASALKASRAFAIIKGISREVRGLTKLWGSYVAEYEREHYVELSRAQARLRFPPRPLLDPDTRAPIREPDTIRRAGAPGEDPVESPNPRAGDLVLTPSPIDHMTEEDWQASGQTLRLPESPATPQIVAVIFAEAGDVAEDSVYRLLALFTLRNQDVHRYWKAGTFAEELEERVDWLLGNAYADEVLELAVVVGEAIDDQFRRKIESLGGPARLGKALRIVGVDLPTSPTPDPTASEPNGSRPTSSTGGPESTDGESTTSSPHPSTSSPGSPPASTTSEPEPERSATP